MTVRKFTQAQDAKETDTNGWFEVKDNPLSKEGVFLYRGAQIRLADGSYPPNKDELYPVYRPAEELEAAADSFKLIPWVDDHTMLGSEELGMTPAEKKGVSGVIGEDVYLKDGTLYGNIKVFSERFARQIEQGKKELSLGYRCSYEYSPGVWNGKKYDYIQRELKGNHLALVDKGRMGADVRVMDSDDIAPNFDYFTLTFDSLMENKQMTLDEIIQQLGDLAQNVAEFKKQQEATPTEEEPKAGDSDLNEDLNGIENQELPPEEGEDEGEEGATFEDKILTILERVEERLTALENPGAEDSDDENKDLEQESSQAMDMAEVTKQVSQRLNARDAMYKRVSAFTGSFNVNAMDSAEAVAAYGCKKLGIKAPKGQEVAAISGYMSGRKPASEQPAVPVGMDGYSEPGKSFLDKQLS